MDKRILEAANKYRDDKIDSGFFRKDNSNEDFIEGIQSPINQILMREYAIEHLRKVSNYCGLTELAYCTKQISDIEKEIEVFKKLI